MSEETKIARLKAPDNVKGTNWRERFYNEQVPVRDRIAEVRRPGNVKDLIRRGWTEVDGDGKKGSNEADKLFVKNFTELIADAKKLPESEELTATIIASEEALAAGDSLKVMSEACKAMTSIMDKIKAAMKDEGSKGGGIPKDGEGGKPSEESEKKKESILDKAKKAAKKFKRKKKG